MIVGQECFYGSKHLHVYTFENILIFTYENSKIIFLSSFRKFKLKSALIGNSVRLCFLLPNIINIQIRFFLEYNLNI